MILAKKQQKTLVVREDETVSLVMLADLEIREGLVERRITRVIRVSYGVYYDSGWQSTRSRGLRLVLVQ